MLLFLSSSLKTLAERYEVFIESSTQLNRQGITDETQRNSNALRGSSAVADKIDAGMLLFRAHDKDRDKVREIIEENGFGKEPNFTRWLYKNRAGQTDLIIWSYLNFSTVREEVLFVTDYDYNIVEDIDDLHFEFKEGRTEKELKQEEQYAEGENTKVFGDIDVHQDQPDDIDF